MMFHALHGLGQDPGEGGTDVGSSDTGGALDLNTESGATSSGGTTTPFLPGTTSGGDTDGTAAGDSALSKLFGVSPGSSNAPSSGSPAAGFNWGILTSLFGIGASAATSVLNAGTSAQIAQAQSAAQIAAAQAAAAKATSSSSTYMTLGIAAVAAIALVMVMKGRH